MMFGVIEHGEVDQPDQVEELSKLEPHRVAVVLVDFQNDFCRPARPDGDPLQTQANAETAWRANDFAAEAARLGMRVIYSQQIQALPGRIRRSGTVHRSGTGVANCPQVPVRRLAESGIHGGAASSLRSARVTGR